MTPVSKLWRWLLRDESGQGGGSALMMLAMTPALLLVFGLIVDGGAKAAALDRANRIAMEAAAAGAQAVSGPGEVSAAAANEAAQAYLSVEGVNGSATLAGDRVDVHVTWSEPTKVLGLIGINDLTVSGDGFAQVIYRVGE